MNRPEIRFLADESCDFAVVRALRSEGYDVVAVSESTSQSVDSDLIVQSAVEKRILLTEDKDFGRLVFVDGLESAGVILIRFPGNARGQLVTTIVNLVRDQGEKLTRAMTVVEPAHVRIRSAPGARGA